jgi:hypothetical protein
MLAFDPPLFRPADMRFRKQNLFDFAGRKTMLLGNLLGEPRKYGLLVSAARSRARYSSAEAVGVVCSVIAPSASVRSTMRSAAALVRAREDSDVPVWVSVGNGDRLGVLRADQGPGPGRGAHCLLTNSPELDYFL